MCTTMQVQSTGSRRQEPRAQGFVDFRALQDLHRQKLMRDFSRELAPEIERFTAIVSSREQPLKERLDKGIAFMKQRLYGRGVSNEVVIHPPEYTYPINAVEWLSLTLSKFVVAEIEATLKAGENLEDSGLLDSQEITRSFRSTQNPMDTSWNMTHWRGQTFDRYCISS